MAAQRAIDIRSAASASCSSSASIALTRVRVCDDIPTFRGAISRALGDHGLEVVSCDALVEGGTAHVDLTVCGVLDEHDWQVLQQIAERQRVFAVVAEPFEENQIRALTLGAAGVARRAAPLDEIVTAICAVPRGYIVIDQQLLRKLCERLVPKPPFELSPHEHQLLQRLATGATIAALADEFGYSNRDMHRTMRRLYDRMQVPNLYQALILATRLGLVD